MNKKSAKKPKLIVRQADIADLPGIQSLTVRAYPGLPAYTLDMLRGQLNHFPQGQFVAEYEGVIVGYCATLLVTEADALKAHTWKEITGGGFASTHDPDGDVVYGMEVCVDPEYRGLRIGQRLYNRRKQLCQDERLKAIVFGGRMPGYGKRAAKVGTPQEYANQVRDKKLRDQVIGFQMRNGFDLLGVLENYLPSDTESAGHAAHMIWRNPKLRAEARTKVEASSAAASHIPETIRLATVQYEQRRVESFDEFMRHVEYFTDVCADYRADFVTFPELFTLQLLSIEDKAVRPERAIAELTKYTEPFKKAMSELAVGYNINIIGGSHPTHVEAGVRNISYVFLRDGSIHQQEKIHPTPNERFWWNIQGGTEVSAIQTDCGPIGVLICYDSEFPELPRHLINQGACILFVPFCTDERQSYLRVRYCAQARAVENQCFVVMSGNVGNLPGVHNMDIQYAQSCILTPCDFQFSRDGIAADTTPNVETVAIADVRMENLIAARNAGTVQNLKDRRHDLYAVQWLDRGAELGR